MEALKTINSMETYHISWTEGVTSKTLSLIGDDLDMTFSRDQRH